MRAAVALLVLALAAAGCLGRGFAHVSTPCEPLVPAGAGGLRVHLRYSAYSEGPPALEGTCVGLLGEPGGDLLAAATVDADGNATLPRLDGGRFVTWAKPNPRDSYCYFEGFAEVPANATALEVELGQVCA